MIKTKHGLFAGFCAACVLGGAGFGAAIAGKNHEIIEADKKFSTKTIEIAVGDTLTFVNNDAIKHNITIKKMKFNSGLQEPGNDVEVIFDKNGKFKVRCGIHPKMKLKVVVN
jgi:plastocyanin